MRINKPEFACESFLNSYVLFKREQELYESLWELTSKSLYKSFLNSRVLVKRKQELHESRWTPILVLLRLYFYQGGVPQGSLSGPPQKRVGQISQQQPNDNYINVAFDLVDLSDGTSSPPPKSAGAAKPKNANLAHSALLPNAHKASLSRKVSAPEYRAQDTSSDYVIVPPRG